MSELAYKALPVLVISTDGDMERHLCSCLLEIPTHSAENLRKSTDWDEALATHLPEIDLFSGIIVAIKSFESKAISLVEAIHRQKKGPVVVVTDCEKSIEACRARGHFHILPFTALAPKVLENALITAQVLFSLRHDLDSIRDEYTTLANRLTDIADNFSDWLWETDAELRLTYSSKRKRPGPEAREGAPLATCFLPEERTRLEANFSDLKHTPKPFHDVEYWSADPHGHHICWSVSGVPVLDKDGHVAGFRGMARDITLAKSATDKVYKLSNKDPLTGLPNRSRFLEDTSHALRKAERDGAEVSAVLLDLDRFKYLNESYGHDVGDRILLHIAQLLVKQVEGVSGLYRVGGDEFGLLITNLGAEDVRQKVQEILNLLHSQGYKHEGKNVPISASAGISRFPQHGKTADALLSRIYIAMHEAKKKGRNRSEDYSQNSQDASVITNRLKWMDFISKCLGEKNDRLVLFFQPIIPLNGHNDGRPRYEVLARLIDGRGNPVPAVDFIEVAEEFGLVSQIDKHITFRAIELLEQWHKAGKKVSLAVNISCVTFEDSIVLSQIAERLRRAEFPAGSLIFEITETAILRDLSQVKKIIDEFRQLGIAFALDDCGVGYSSFNYIKQLDLDFIKIDGSFIRNLHGEGSKDEAFVRALHNVAKEMSILTVAEAVEQEETVGHLKRIGVDFAQGYYFGYPAAQIREEEPPTPEEEFH